MNGRTWRREIGDLDALALVGQANVNRDKAAAAIDHLAVLRAERHVPSERQLHSIADLAKKAGLDETAACAVVGQESCAELTGGKEGPPTP